MYNTFNVFAGFKFDTKIVFFYIHREIEEYIILIYNSWTIFFLRLDTTINLYSVTSWFDPMYWNALLAIAVCSCFKPNRKRRFGVWFLDRLSQSDSRGCAPGPPSSCQPPVYLLLSSHWPPQQSI